MKKVIVNNDKIRVTANGQSIVEGSFANVTEIRGRSVKCNNLIPKITNKELDGTYIKVQSNNSISISGISTAQGGYTYHYIGTVVLNKGDYCLSGFPDKYDQNKAVFYIAFKDENNTSVFKYANTTFKAISDTEEALGVQQKNVDIYIRISNVPDTLTIYPMLNKGTTPLPYQPYFTGIKNSTIRGIYSHNRNLLNKSQSQLISDGYAGTANFSQDLLDLINKENVTALTISSEYRSNIINWNKSNQPRLTIRLDNQYEYLSTSQSYTVHNGTIQKRKLTRILNKQDKYNTGLIWFNDFSQYRYSKPLGVEEPNSYISVKNQLEIGEHQTRYVETETYQIDFVNLREEDIVLRSSLEDESLYDVYYPKSGVICRIINSDGSIKTKTVDGKTVLNPTIEKFKYPINFSSYKAFNKGFEKIISSVNSEGLSPLDYGAVPEIVTEYEVEEKQGSDGTRFDFITLDGEAICGIGYEKLKSTNQLQYVSEPSRQNDGSMQNIEDYETFVLPALEIGFNCIKEETYRRLKQKLLSKRTFDVAYYDKDFDKVISMEMYVKPIDLDNFLSYGDEIIGMNTTLSFIPTLNEETKYSVKFYTANNELYKEYSGDKNGVLYGRTIETPTLPSTDYNYWLIIESGFKENSYVKIKGKKKLSIFGDTKLIAIK